MSYYAGSCDVAVIGAGHAGIEAALAAARLGNHTILFTINLDAVGNMPCNPAIGGTGKGHLVRELDALGGEMGAAADHACIQYRMLNRGKGPAVHSLRAQADRVKYRQYMKHTLELQENLELKQAQIVEILTTDGAVTGVCTQLGAQYGAKAVVIATGTYLDSTVITGQSVIPSGPDGMHPSVGLADNLRALGLHLLGRDHGRGGRRDLAAVGVADEGDGHLRRVADLLNEALLIGRVVKHVLHLRDERLTGIVVGNQAKQAADFRHVTLSVDRWSPPRGSIAS